MFSPAPKSLPPRKDLGVDYIDSQVWKSRGFSEYTLVQMSGLENFKNSWRKNCFFYFIGKYVFDVPTEGDNCWSKKNKTPRNG